MSDLHCPATLCVARHGDAAFGHASVPSEEGGWLTERGTSQVRELAESLRPRRVAAVYSSTMQCAVESAALAAQVLDTTAREVDGLQEISVGENGPEVLARVREALQGLADLHRGECVLVFSHGGVLSFAVPRLGRRLRADLARERFLPNCAVAEVTVDADGFEVVSWPGTPDRTVV
jgi:probable phosphoglycerate mutase